MGQTLQSMLSAQNHLQRIERMSRVLRIEQVAGKPVDPTGGLDRSIRNGRETQQGEMAMAAQCLRTMYPAANEQRFEVAL